MSEKWGSWSEAVVNVATDSLRLVAEQTDSEMENASPQQRDMREMAVRAIQTIESLRNEREAGRSVVVGDVAWQGGWFELLKSRNGFWFEFGDRRKKSTATKRCSRYFREGGTDPKIIARYPGDPEALYFSADHPEGVPVEWEDVR